MTIKDTTYFQVQAWMVTKLKLKTVERDVFAIIYGYSQDEESDYHGSLAYMAELTGYSRNSICTALKNLTAKNYIIKTEKECNNIKYCRYTTNFDTVQAACTPIQTACTNNIVNNTSKVSSKDDTLVGDSADNFVFGKKVPKQRKITNTSEYESALLLADNYSNNKELVSELHKLIDMKHEMCGKQRYKFWCSTIQNYLDELDKQFGADDKQKIEAVKLSIRYNATMKVMVPNTYSGNNIDSVTGMKNGVRNAYESEDQSFVEGVVY